MNYVAQAIRSARDEACGTISMESILNDLDAQGQSVDQIVEDQETMIALAEGLTKISVSAESVREDDYLTHSALRLSAVEHLRVAGMDEAEAHAVFPALEAANPKSGWERFKEFIRKLWDFIVKAAKQIFNIVDGVLKKSSVAEKMAMMQLRQLRLELGNKKTALTVAPIIALKPSHRYLFSPKGQLANMADLKKNLQDYRAARDKIQNELPNVIEKMTQDLIDCVDRLQVTNPDDAVVSKSVEDNMSRALEAVKPMFPYYLGQTLGISDYRLPLIYDRVVEIHNPDFDENNLDSPAFINQLGISVAQEENKNVDLETMGTFPAMRVNEIDEALKLATDMLDENQSTDQRRMWERLARKTRRLDATISSTVNAVLKRPNLTEEAREGLRLILAAKQATSKWAAMPYVQLNGVNTRVVQALLAMIRDQLANYDHEDTLEERMGAKRGKDAKN